MNKHLKMVATENANEKNKMSDENYYIRFRNDTFFCSKEYLKAAISNRIDELCKKLTSGAMKLFKKYTGRKLYEDRASIIAWDLIVESVGGRVINGYETPEKGSMWFEFCENWCEGGDRADVGYLGYLLGSIREEKMIINDAIMNIDELSDFTENDSINCNYRESIISGIEEVLSKAGFETEKQIDGLIWKTDNDESVFIPVDQDGKIQDFRYTGHKNVEIKMNVTDNSLDDHIDYCTKLLEAANIKSYYFRHSDSHISISIYINAINDSINICFDQKGYILYIVTDSTLEEYEKKRIRLFGRE